MIYLTKPEIELLKNKLKEEIATLEDMLKTSAFNINLEDVAAVKLEIGTLKNILGKL